MRLPFSHFTTAVINSDFRNYRELLASKGKTLDSTAQEQLYAFATGLYALYGRTDFWAFNFNVGSGTRAYSFHGVEGVFMGNVTWAARGVRTPAGSDANYMRVPSYIANNFRARSGFTVIETAGSETVFRSLYNAQGGAPSGPWDCLFYYNNNTSWHSGAYIGTTRNGFMTVTTPGSGIIVNTPVSVGFRIQSTSEQTFLNGALAKDSGWMSPNINPAPYTVLSIAGRLDGYMSLLVVKESPVDMSALHGLAKKTVCPFLP